MLAEMRRTFVDVIAHEKVIPIVEDRAQLLTALKGEGARAILLRHCNLLEFDHLLMQVRQQNVSILVNMDHIEGVNADAAGLCYLAEHLGITGILSNHVKVLALARAYGLTTGLRVFAADSTGLEGALESIDSPFIDFLDVSPALVIPHITPSFLSRTSLPFIASGLVATRKQVQTVLHAGALAVAVTQPDLWRMVR